MDTDGQGLVAQVAQLNPSTEHGRSSIIILICTSPISVVQLARKISNSNHRL